MKNIHLIPTDKPTGIFELNNGLHFSITNKVRYGVYKGYHIYITDDEKIKVGDWTIATDGGWKDTITKITGTPITDVWKKIILTTDPDLIKDGVQAIDDEFLEWFVKNPSCEEVEIYLVELCDNCGQQHCDNGNCRGYKDEKFYLISTSENTTERVITYCDGYKVKEEPKQSTVGKEFFESADKIITVYKQDIIQLIEDRILSEYKKHSASLPDEWAKIAAYKIYKSISDKMENPKQHIEFINNNIEEFDESLKSFKQKQYLIDMMRGDEELGLYNEPKQETIEEAAERLVNRPYGNVVSKSSFIEGAEYQAERMYSEEEVRKLLETQRGNCYVAILTKTKDKELAAIAGGAPEPNGYNGWVKQSKEEILEEPNISVEEALLLMRKAPITFVPNKRMYSEVFEWLATKDYLSDKVDIIQKEFEQFKKKLI